MTVVKGFQQLKYILQSGIRFDLQLCNASLNIKKSKNIAIATGIQTNVMAAPPMKRDDGASSTGITSRSNDVLSEK